MPTPYLDPSTSCDRRSFFVIRAQMREQNSARSKAGPGCGVNNDTNTLCSPRQHVPSIATGPHRRSPSIVACP